VLNYHQSLGLELLLDSAKPAYVQFKADCTSKHRQGTPRAAMKSLEVRSYSTMRKFDSCRSQWCNIFCVRCSLSIFYQLLDLRPIRLHKWTVRFSTVYYCRFGCRGILWIHFWDIRLRLVIALAAVVHIRYQQRNCILFIHNVLTQTKLYI
jgi:hypothetical protein